MKKNILLVNPWIYDFAAYDFWLAPLGLLSLAAFLRKNGYGIRMIDCLRRSVQASPLPRREKRPRRFPAGHGHFFKEPLPKPAALHAIPKRYNRYGITEAEFRKGLQAIRKPELILVTSMMTYWYPAVFDTITILKGEFPNVPIVLGGNYVTLCPEHAQKAGADLLVGGEGEPQLLEILKKFLGDDIIFQVDPADLDSYPYPAYDLYDRLEQISIMTSRGCPFRCSYCASHRINPDYRRRNPIKVADEIASWHERYGVCHFSFYDDALLIDPEGMAIPLLKEIIRRTPNCQFHCPNGLHLREVTPELARLMFRAGFRTIRFGFETADVNRQRETGGKVANEHLERAAAYLREAGYAPEDIGIYLLCGLPGQTAIEVREAINHVKRCGARPVIAEYSPIPGTALWDASVIASPYPIAEEPLFQNNSLLPCRSSLLTFEMYQDLKRETRNVIFC
ncbi:MAG: hypothetical protein CVU74_09050 [Deltaproteobacteria bacterium HGW-Deltaproteobacteria-9]|nr:MAG: hypothetical protein CVU74_09050 [Deltaproteobacteria bacterium HGW-Deltaproteobacteria-9]